MQQQLGIKEILGNVTTQSMVSDVFILYHLKGCNIEVWVLSGTAGKMKYIPAHLVTEQLPKSVLSKISGFRTLTGCNTMLCFSDKGKNTFWKMFVKYANLLSGRARDDNVDDAWAFVCSLYGIRENDVKGIGDTRHNIFVKVKRDPEVLPPTHHNGKVSS